MFSQLSVNPFSSDYYQQELRSINVKEGSLNNVRLELETVSGRVDGYMYMNFLEPVENVPMFYVGNTLWMSLTPMEIESHYFPIFFAEGRVGVAGLGLGYYVQRILDKEDVEEVVVYELNQDVIDFYYHNFGKHDKLTIIKEDIRTVKGEYFDFFYCDIYETQLELQAIDDMALITAQNNIEGYHFWTMEQMVFELAQAGYAEEIPRDWIHSFGTFIALVVEEKGGLCQTRGIGHDIYEALEECGLTE